MHPTHDWDTDTNGIELLIRRDGEDTVGVSIGDHTLDDAHSTVLPTSRLLEMIDAVAPDAMRAYLRETAPEVIADLYRPAPAAAEHFDYLDNDTEPTGHTARVTPEQLDQTPVADSPEDVDEHPDHDDQTERAQLDRAWALEKVVTLFSAGIGSRNAIKVADWIINGTEVTDR